MPDAEVDDVLIATVATNPDLDPAAYDIVYTSNAGMDRIRARFPDADRLTRLCALPNVSFAGFHPDICYVGQDAAPGGREMTVAGQHYHSVICFAAYQRGLDAAQTQALFSRPFMERCGYLDAYAGARAALSAIFEAHGLDMSMHFARWCRQGPFMHTVNHPRIDVLRDILGACLRRDGLLDGKTAAQVEGAGVYDNLMRGPIFPIYPDIAQRYGVTGSYAFRVAQGRVLSLGQFIETAHAAYRERNTPDTAILTGKAQYAAVCEVLEQV